jgi:hypothetical protein
VCWGEVGDTAFLGPQMIRDTSEQIKLICQRMKTAHSRQASYFDPRHREVEFDVGDLVFLKVSPMRGIRRFGLKGKLSPHFVGPFEVLKRVGKVAYMIALPPHLQAHNVFHVSMLRRCLRDPSQHIPMPEVELDECLTYQEKPVRILDRDVKRTRNSVINLVKVAWSSNPKDATWELESKMLEKHP